MKNYDEIANSVFERRDKYIANQKKKKQIVISIVAPIICCCIVLIVSFGLWNSGIFSNNIPVIENSQNVVNNSSSDNNQNSNTNSSNSSQDNNPSSNPSNNSSSQDVFIADNSTPSTPSEEIPSNPSNDSSAQNGFIPHNSTPSKPSEEIPSNPSNNSSSQGGSIPDNSTPSKPSEENSSKPSDNTSSNNTPSNPPVIETNYFIDSIDKINFYSVKKIIIEKSLLPIGMSANIFSRPKMLLLNKTYSEYPIDRDKVFTATMVTYFTIELNDDKGFLAQKLGGTGFVEVVVTDSDMEEMGQMITFKRNDKYYTCFMNGQDNELNSNKVSREFSSHKYIDGFNIVKNLEQENYKFTVHYDGLKVVGFECNPFQSVPTNYVVDDITFIEDFCVVIYAKQTFTIDELESYFKHKN